MVCGCLSYVVYFISFIMYCLKGFIFVFNLGGSILVLFVKFRMFDIIGLLVVVFILVFMVMEKL